MSYRYCKVRDAATQAVLYARVAVPVGFLHRARGLLGRNELAEDEGMLFTNCGSIHMLGMRFPIDVLFLGKRGEIMRCVHRLQPGRFARQPAASYTLETRQGSIGRKSLKTDMRLAWEYN